MEFRIDWISLLYMVGISYGVFFAAVLLGIGKEKSSSNRLLAFLVLSYALFILPFFLTRTGALYVFPHLIGASTPFYFTLGPLFFLYVLSLTKPDFQVDIGPRHLSQVINENLNRNFFDFVNRYRVEEAKKLLINLDKSRNSILDVAFDSGFNSKSSFNMIFKKYTAMTPSQFRKKHMEDRQM